jgi:hypothetical protein
MAPLVESPSVSPSSWIVADAASGAEGVEIARAWSAASADSGVVASVVSEASETFIDGGGEWVVTKGTPRARAVRSVSEDFVTEVVSQAVSQAVQAVVDDDWVVC